MVMMAMAVNFAAVVDLSTAAATAAEVLGLTEVDGKTSHCSSFDISISLKFSEKK